MAERKFTVTNILRDFYGINPGQEYYQRLQQALCFAYEHPEVLDKDNFFPALLVHLGLATENEDENKDPKDTLYRAVERGKNHCWKNKPRYPFQCEDDEGKYTRPEPFTFIDEVTGYLLQLDKKRRQSGKETLSK